MEIHQSHKSDFLFVCNGYKTILVLDLDLKLAILQHFDVQTLVLVCPQCTPRRCILKIKKQNKKNFHTQCTQQSGNTHLQKILVFKTIIWSILNRKILKTQYCDTKTIPQVAIGSVNFVSTECSRILSCYLHAINRGLYTDKLLHSSSSQWEAADTEIRVPSV